MATARAHKWAGTDIAFGFMGDPTPVSFAPSISHSGLFEHTNLYSECLRLKAVNAELRAENESLKAKVVAMELTSTQPKENQINWAAIIGGIVNQIQEEFTKYPLVSGAYFALSEEMNEISINVIMDSLDYDTEKELIKFFIREEDEFPNIRIQTRFPVLTIEEAEGKYKDFKVCYKRDK